MRPTFAEINLDALVYNYSLLRDLAGKQIEILPVLKADAYGHGALPVARELIHAKAQKVAVATLEEGIELREAGFQVPIVILGGVLDRQAPQVVSYQLTPFIYDLKTAQTLSEAWSKHYAASRIPNPESKKIKDSAFNPQPSALSKLKVHVKVDTGMGRLGIPYPEVLEFLKTLYTYPGIEVEGLATHLSTADEPDQEFTRTQVSRFQAVYDQIKKAGYKIPFYHISNSAGILNSLGRMRDPFLPFNMVRPGIALYGISPSPHLADVLPLKSVMQFKTEVVFLKQVPPGMSIGYGRTFTTSQKSLIATLPLGYADGYHWSLSNKGEVLIRGMRCPVVGRVCMDFCMVNVSQVPGVSVGDEVVLFGDQGANQITAVDVATWAGTIPYEVICSIGRRVPRVYLKDGKIICVRGQDQMYRYPSGMLNPE